jgi:signal transduction histidine kinase
MTTTFLLRSDGSPRREAAQRALRDAGVGVVEIDDWKEAAESLRDCDAAVVISSAELESLDASRLTRAVHELSGAKAEAALPHDAARALSHDLRTPLTSMAGWVHLIETGKLDEAGLKRVASKLRGNIDEQVKTIERFLGATRQKNEADL